MNPEVTSGAAIYHNLGWQNQTWKEEPPAGCLRFARQAFQATFRRAVNPNVLNF
jgi:hypothetical protein